MCNNLIINKKNVNNIFNKKLLNRRYKYIIFANFFSKNLYLYFKNLNLDVNFYKLTNLKCFKNTYLICFKKDFFFIKFLNTIIKNKLFSENLIFDSILFNLKYYLNYS